jgi:hypothetical protein
MDRTPACCRFRARPRRSAQHCGGEIWVTMWLSVHQTKCRNPRSNLFQVSS